MANLSAFGGAQPITPGGMVELGYAESDANLSINATVAASMTNISPELTVVCDGSPVMVEFFCAGARATVDAAGTTDALWFTLKVDGSVEEERLGVVGNVAGGYGSLTPIKLSHRMTPSAGSHTFRVGGWVSNAARTGYIGGGSPYPPAWIRVSKIVQQNDGLKPFWTPPVVTQLPSNATVGDQVVYAADATNGVYWSLYYDGIGTYPWKYIGGPPLHNSNGSYPGAINNASFVDVPSAANVTAPLDGDYMVDFNGKADFTSSQYGSLNNVTVMTATVAPSVAKAAGVATYTTSGGYVRGSFSRLVNLDGVSAGETIKMQARADVGSVSVVYHYTGMSVTPVRVAA